MPPSVLEDFEVSEHAHDLAEADDRTELAGILVEVEEAVAPLWPLNDYVAVNPFVGFAQHTFLETRQTLCGVRNCDVLPSAAYLKDQLSRNAIARDDLERAIRQCIQEYPGQFEAFDVDEVMEAVTAAPNLPGIDERVYFTISEIVDRQMPSSWTSHIANDITRHCAAHYDEGQAAWRSPWSESSLFQAWREASLVSCRMGHLGIKGFHRVCCELPTRPEEAIARALRELEIPPAHWKSFLICELLSVAGWASYIKYRVREADRNGRRDDDLRGLLAIRLAYDLALARERKVAWTPAASIYDDSSRLQTGQARVAQRPALARYALQVACEVGYRRKLIAALEGASTAACAASRKHVQMVFCIDVRSEVIRRHLESLSSDIETLGFAGFFGMPLEYVPLGEDKGAAQCPVLLQPSFRIRETVTGSDHVHEARAIRERWTVTTARKVWKSFQSSAVSCFSFVESVGVFYLGKLLANSLGLTRPKSGSELTATSVRPQILPDGDCGLALAKRIDLAEGMLRNLGLTSGFARIVTFCGHAAQVVNNPYKAGLNCGACGGHSGEPNARVAAALLNDPEVRSGLETRGIHIPGDTVFVPAVHNTTTDEVELLDTAGLPDVHGAGVAQVRQWLARAGALTRAERSRRLGNAPAEDIFRRSQDWSEVRPEWGLAGNAAFIVAPRSRTAGLDLGGRTFLHNYDRQRDPDLKVLELIMTAPMIVTNWINLQYYASTVDNRAFGSGNKVLHNVVGQFGVLEGNGGDLMTGLPWQSIHDGRQFQHEPLRLLVVIEAPRTDVEQILTKHPFVRDLASNGWLSLEVIDEGSFYRWTSDQSWELDECQQR